MYETGFEQKVKSWINTPNDEGLTAIHFAALQGNIEMIMLLENLGANM
jgi:ankyrin repeat protein